MVFAQVFAIGSLPSQISNLESRKGPIVRQVDRILVESGDPKTLFDFFSNELQLPTAWPIAENQGYISGGLGAGNVTIEFFRHTQQKGVPASKTPAARYAGLALEPYPLSDALRELKVGGIPFSTPEPFISTLPDGSRGALWTTVPLPSLSKSGTSIFLYEYSPKYLKVEVRRKQLGNRLTLNKGGPLEIQSVREIVIASASFEKDKAAWKQLLGKSTAPNIWNIGTGPSIRLVPGKQDRIREIVLAVKSLNSAKDFLTRTKASGSAAATSIILHPLKVQGLNIRLVQ